MPERRFRHGLVIGKFYPPHAGHHHLIRSALRACERVTVEVLVASVETTPLADRIDWLAESHPTARVVGCIDDLPVDFESQAAHDSHTEVIRALLDEPVDAVFTSDPYGAEVARRLDATWVEVDPHREANAVSGTAIRADLAGHWSELEAATRAGLASRIVIIGAESTGTTTLSEALAAHYGVPCVPEYGRDYTYIREGGLDAEWRSDEFTIIVDRQIELEDVALRRTPKPFVICDTDVLATALWHERYVGTEAPSILARAAAHLPACYVLTGDEIPFVQDGWRDGEGVRTAMQQRFREALAAQPVPWIEVRGPVERRLAEATVFIDRIITERSTFAVPLTPPTRLPGAR